MSMLLLLPLKPKGLFSLLTGKQDDYFHAYFNCLRPFAREERREGERGREREYRFVITLI